MALNVNESPPMKFTVTATSYSLVVLPSALAVPPSRIFPSPRLESDLLLTTVMVLPLLFTSWRFVLLIPQTASRETLTEGVGVLVGVDAHPVRSPTVSRPRVKAMVRGESFNGFP